MNKFKFNQAWVALHIFFALCATYVPFAFNQFSMATYAIGGEFGPAEKIYLMGVANPSIAYGVVAMSFLAPLAIKKTIAYSAGLLPLMFVIYSAVGLKTNPPPFLDLKNIEFLKSLSNPLEVHQLGLAIGFYLAVIFGGCIAFIAIRVMTNRVKIFSTSTNF